MHMSEATALEAQMPTVLAACESLEAADVTSPAHAAAASAFAGHTFFCFNASSPESGTIIPVTANSTGPNGQMSWILLYTCEVVLEHARPTLQAAGAFQSLPMAATAVPAAAVLTSLQTPGNNNAGVHINEFAPGIAPEYKALGISTAAFARLVQLGGVAEPGVVV